MTNKPKFVKGDRVAYTSAHLRATGQISARSADRRGEFVSEYTIAPGWAQVKWDDFESRADLMAKNHGADYVVSVRENGELCHITSLVKVGSIEFSKAD